MTGDLQSNRSAANRGADEEAAEAWMPAERALLEATLDFYGAAEGVIDFAGQERPQVRQDAAGFEAVRRTMGVLEDRVRSAHAAGVGVERIAEVARIEREMVELILERGPAAAPDPSEG